jgi:hypothetical protein
MNTGVLFSSALAEVIFFESTTGLREFTVVGDAPFMEFFWRRTIFGRASFN